ncbi:MBL fold metallo-hydrolase [uncultured Marixanthomonas sp.]|uniref:MBL fold metallo-hydrolase n=1 Tax=uncultured Marixanthomonas sp. TaxID=757245 RepID=UPI0030DCF5A6
MKRIFLLTLTVLFFTACNNSEKKKTEEAPMTAEMEQPETMDEPASEDFIDITPIEHATMVLQWDDTVLYVDPVGGAEAFEGQPEPDMILVTDIHGDHMNIETIQAVATENTIVIAPQAVNEKLPKALQDKVQVMNNGESAIHSDIAIEAMPMYNLREEALKFHKKGRGNGYILEKDDKRVYISGDTEDIPEMRNLSNIDIAFVCMNLPYTMPVDKAAEAVLAFKPNVVYPYHFRGTEGLSNVSKFKDLVNKGDASITVTQLDWYPNQ